MEVMFNGVRHSEVKLSEFKCFFTRVAITKIGCSNELFQMLLCRRLIIIKTPRVWT